VNGSSAFNPAAVAQTDMSSTTVIECVSSAGLEQFRF
jgi:hypothetical protein